MAADMAVDFKDTGIAAVSIWMGSLLTQRVRDIVARNPAKLGHILDTAGLRNLPATSSQGFTKTRPRGPERTDAYRCGASGKYGSRTRDDRQPPSYRDLHGVHPHPQFPYVMR